MRAEILSVLIEHGKVRVDELLGVKKAGPDDVLRALAECVGDAKTVDDAVRLGEMFWTIDKVRRAFDSPAPAASAVAATPPGEASTVEPEPAAEASLPEPTPTPQTEPETPKEA